MASFFYKEIYNNESWEIIKKFKKRINQISNQKR